MAKAPKTWKVCRHRNGRHEIIAGYNDEKEARWHADRLVREGDGHIYLEETVYQPKNGS